jgi:protocatechuate 3,4-dioxygenase beta subunit
MRPVTKAIALIVHLSLARSISAFAQASGSSAELRGQVVDSSGAVIHGAAITIIDLAKGSTRSTTTDAEGNYAFIGLLPINRRNFLDYALLTPGVADADNIADDR